MKMTISPSLSYDVMLCFLFCNLKYVLLFDASRRGKKQLESCREQNEGAYRSLGGGEKSLLGDPGSELRLKEGEGERKMLR